MWNNFEKIAEHLKSLHTSESNPDDNITVDVSDDKLIARIRYALTVIFSNSDEHFRQRNIHKLLQKLYHSFAKKPTRFAYEQAVKQLLPVVKTRLLNDDLAFNMNHFSKYPELNPEDVYEVVTNKLGSSEFRIDHYELKGLSHNVNGHLGDYYHLTVHLMAPDDSLKFFVKFATPKTEDFKEFALSGIAASEEYFYREFKPLAREVGVHLLDGITGDCYFGRENDVFVFDDLVRAHGYNTLEPGHFLDLQQVQDGLRALVKLHATSIILEERLPGYDKHKCLKERFLVQDEDFFFKDSLDEGVRCAYKLSEKFLRKKDLGPSINAAWDLTFQRLRTSSRFRNVLCHGDLHSSNLMFKNHQIAFVDFQIIRYCPPIHDALFYIYGNTTKSLRDQHLTTLLDQYYRKMAAVLHDHNLDPSRVFPREEFDASIDYMKVPTLMTALYYAPFKRVPEHVNASVMRKGEAEGKRYLFAHRWEFLELVMDQDQGFRDYIRGLIEELGSVFLLV